MTKSYLKLKRVYQRPQKDDGFRILVDRLWPRGVSKEKAKIDLWLKDLAPTDELRKWFNHQPEKWPGFLKKYKKELEKKQITVAQFKKILKSHPQITLLYAAKDEKYNNALALKKIFKI